MLVSVLLTAPLAAASPLPAAPSPAAGAPAGAETEEVGFETRDRQEISGTFFVPKDTSSLAPGVLLLHDAGGERSQLAELAERLQRVGFAVLSIDLRAHGESKAGAKRWSAMDEDERSTTWAFASRDVEAASQWLSRHQLVHSTNISIVGLRAGSTLAVRHAARDQNIMAAVLIAPRAQQLGFDLEAEIQDLEGLPTCILAQRDEAQAAEALSARGNGSGDPFIEVIKVSTRKAGEDVIDRRQINDIARWLKTQAMPQKGGR